MPRSKPQLYEEGRVREDWEYLEWAARVSRDAEDIRSTTDEVKWREHVQDKYAFSLDDEKRERQVNALWSRGVLKTWEELPARGVIPSTRYTPTGHYFQYRDTTTGRFISLKEVSQKLGFGI